MIIDEVQDLTFSTILLLTRITEQRIFLCGDTAQSISRTTGMRFAEMKEVFDVKYATANPVFLDKPQQKQLRVKFI